jgi:hypothetical protein
MSFNSKYEGQEVEQLLDIVANGGAGGGSSAYPQINHGTSDTTFTLTPNTLHVWDEVASLDLTLGEPREGIVNEYIFQFSSGNVATTLTLPEGLKWVEGISPFVLANRCYQVSIVNGFVLMAEFNHYIVNEINMEYDYYDGNIHCTAKYPLARTLYLFTESGHRWELPEGEQYIELGWGSAQGTWDLLISLTDNINEAFVGEINDGTYLYRIPEELNIFIPEE